VLGALARLGEVARGGGAEANAALRRLLGGGVVVHEHAGGGRKRKFLTGTFTLVARQLFPAVNTGGGTAAEPLSETFEIGFREPPAWGALSQQVKDLWDAGQKYEEIAAQLMCKPHWVPKALAWWHQERGLPAPDGRLAVGRLHRPTVADEIIDRAKELWDQELPIWQIAERLRCDRNAVTRSIQAWFRSRGLPVPDNRARRKELGIPDRPRAGPGDDRAGEAPGRRSPGGGHAPADPGANPGVADDQAAA
jgi:hypothetical protein